MNESILRLPSPFMHSMIFFDCHPSSLNDFAALLSPLSLCMTLTRKWRRLQGLLGFWIPERRLRDYGLSISGRYDLLCVPSFLVLSVRYDLLCFPSFPVVPSFLVLSVKYDLLCFPSVPFFSVRHGKPFCSLGWRLTVHGAE